MPSRQQRIVPDLDGSREASLRHLATARRSSLKFFNGLNRRAESQCLPHHHVQVLQAPQIFPHRLPVILEDLLQLRVHFPGLQNACFLCQSTSQCEGFERCGTKTR